MKKKSVTVVIPVHNEQDSIPPLTSRIRAALQQTSGWKVHLLFVDDGSTDNTIGVLEGLRGKGIPVGYLKLSRNFGHQAALEAGLLVASGDAVITMDGDLQHPPEAIPGMLAAFEDGVDVVQMVRSKQTQGSKGAWSKLFYSCFDALSHVKIVPDAADFRLLSRRVVDVVKQIPEREKFLRALIPALGFTQTCITFEEQERVHGSPSYSFRKSLRLARKALFDYSTIPLRFVFWLGTTLAVLSFLFGMGHVLMKLFAWHDITPGFTDIVTSILFLSGCTLASLGILGRYMLIILEHVRGRPVFVVTDHVQGDVLPAETAAQE